MQAWSKFGALMAFQVVQQAVWLVVPGISVHCTGEEEHDGWCHPLRATISHVLGRGEVPLNLACVTAVTVT